MKTADNLWVRTTNRFAEAQERAAAEDGEIASWLILAAGLCAAALAASGILMGTITDLANAVG